MGKIKLLLTILVLGIFILGSVGESNAQTVKIKRLAVSPSTLKGFPSGSISNGLRVVGKGSTVYFSADTTGSVTSFTWSVVGPSSSNASFNTTSGKNVIFTPDIEGQYVVTVSINGGKTSSDTIFASTYVGGLTQDCAPCHFQDLKKYDSWKLTGHATLFKNGITGNLETTTYNGQAVGTYGTSCAKCHTVGYDVNVDNGNFGYEAHKTGFDTTWYKGDFVVGSSIYVPSNSQTAWNLLTTDPQYSTVAQVATIGCENCHGPGNYHKNAGLDVSGQYINVSLDAGVCLKCHDGPTRRMIGAYYLASNHATMPLAGTDATSNSCFPCHSGSAFVKYAENPTTPGYNSSDAGQDITCVACHNPHVADNFGLRQTSVTLLNGFQVANAGNGNICATCHRARQNVTTILKDSQAPYYGFKDRFGPHRGPQADMFFGQNAYNYGNTSIDGLQTHTGLQDACVTCHMANIGPSAQPSHQWSMVDTTGGTAKDFVVACRNCHGQNINSFDDIKASYDFDGNGKIEGAQTEVTGLMNKLKSLLPADSKNPSVLVSFMYDSLLVKNKPAVIRGLYTYAFVSEDKSIGVHNTKYAVSILQAAINALGGVTGVDITKTPNKMDFSLFQNYPNPFNPSTTIRYTLANESHVKISVYNVTGALITVLTEVNQSAGTHQVEFNTGSRGQVLASGIYFYTIEATSLSNSKTFRETKKMILLK